MCGRLGFLMGMGISGVSRCLPAMARMVSPGSASFLLGLGPSCAGLACGQIIGDSGCFKALFRLRDGAQRWCWWRICALWWLLSSSLLASTLCVGHTAVQSVCTTYIEQACFNDAARHVFLMVIVSVSVSSGVWCSFRLAIYHSVYMASALCVWSKLRADSLPLGEFVFVGCLIFRLSFVGDLASWKVIRRNNLACHLFIAFIRAVVYCLHFMFISHDHLFCVRVFNFVTGYCLGFSDPCRHLCIVGGKNCLVCVTWVVCIGIVF